MEHYKTKEEAENQIKEMNIPGAFSPTFIFPRWYIMRNATGLLNQDGMKPLLRDKLIKYLNLPLSSCYIGRSCKGGRKYIRICNILTNGQHSAINFLDPTNGKLYKANSWRQKGRLIGNLYDLV